MKLRIVLLAAVVAAATWATPVYAGHQLPHASPFSKMSLKQLERYQERSLRFHQTVVQRWVVSVTQIRFDRFVIREGSSVDVAFPHTWRWCGMLGSVAPRYVCWHEHAIRWVRRELSATKDSLTPSSPDCVGASNAACAWYLDGATQCEVAHEGAWTTDSNYPYAGKFQMDESFEKATDPSSVMPSDFGKRMQETYGRANNWPHGAQIEHAYGQFLLRGWGPWPPYYNYGCAAYHGGTYTA